MVETTFSLFILILESLCDVLYECMLNSTDKLQINQFSSYLILSFSRCDTVSSFFAGRGKKTARETEKYFTDANDAFKGIQCMPSQISKTKSTEKLGRFLVRSNKWDHGSSGGSTTGPLGPGPQAPSYRGPQILNKQAASGPLVWLSISRGTASRPTGAKPEPGARGYICPSKIYGLRSSKGVHMLHQQITI